MAKKSTTNKRMHGSADAPSLAAKAVLPTKFGKFTIYGFEGRGPQEEAVALVRGDLKGRVAPLGRVDLPCLTGDWPHSPPCDCRGPLGAFLKKTSEAPSG